jgi:hypothetical protein
MPSALILHFISLHQQSNSFCCSHRRRMWYYDEKKRSSLGRWSAEWNQAQGHCACGVLISRLSVSAAFVGIEVNCRCIKLFWYWPDSQICKRTRCNRGCCTWKGTLLWCKSMKALTWWKKVNVAALVSRCLLMHSFKTESNEVYWNS